MSIDVGDYVILTYLGSTEMVKDVDWVNQLVKLKHRTGWHKLEYIQKCDSQQDNQLVQ